MGSNKEEFMKKNIKAFTLAETLITLMVIGVVAALTIPALMQQINGYTLQKQKDVFSKKWQEGLRQMRVDGKLENSYTTAEFVNEMGKYFKIQAVCDSDNLSGCFAEKITSYENGETEEFDVKDLKSAKNFNKSEEDSPVYGIRFSDGTSMLLAYKKDCKGISEGDTQGNHTQCLLYVYDVNANKSPNSYGGNTGTGSNKSDSEISTMTKGRDIVGNASITKGNAYGLSFEMVDIADRSTFGCADATKATGDEHGSSTCDYWLGAKRYCESKGLKLPTESQLTEMAEKIYADAGCILETYDGQPRYKSCTNQPAITSHPLFFSLNAGSDFGVWSNISTNDSCAGYRFFYNNISGNVKSASRPYNNAKAVCVR